jgi:hypothetical protein
MHKPCVCVCVCVDVYIYVYILVPWSLLLFPLFASASYVSYACLACTPWAIGRSPGDLRIHTRTHARTHNKYVDACIFLPDYSRAYQARTHRELHTTARKQCRRVRFPRVGSHVPGGACVRPLLNHITHSLSLSLCMKQYCAARCRRSWEGCVPCGGGVSGLS